MICLQSKKLLNEKNAFIASEAIFAQNLGLGASN